MEISSFLLNLKILLKCDVQDLPYSLKICLSIIFFENSFRLGIKGKIEYNFKHDIKLAVLAA